MKLTEKSNEELLKLMADLEGDPANKNIGSSLFLYNEKTRRTLDKIREQITFNLAEKRREEGRPVVCDGYSGRKSNRRR